MHGRRVTFFAADSDDSEALRVEDVVGSLILCGRLTKAVNASNGERVDVGLDVDGDDLEYQVRSRGPFDFLALTAERWS